MTTRPAPAPVLRWFARALAVLAAALAYALVSGASASADVGPDGGFRTAIAFQVPAFHGITPALGLTYDSNAGNGPVGTGWSLSGDSAVPHRLPPRWQ